MNNRAQASILATLKVDDVFFVGKAGQVSLYCTVLERRTDQLDFVVKNGGWGGTVCLSSGALLAIGGGRVEVDDPAFEIVYADPVPKGLRSRDYNTVMSWVQRTLASREASCEVPSDIATMSSP